MKIKEQKLGQHANKINNKMKPLQKNRASRRIERRFYAEIVTAKDVKTYNLTIWTAQTPLRVENKRGRTQVFRNNKQKLFVVICDTDVAANQEVLAIAELSKKSLKIPKEQSESVYRRRKDTRWPKEKVKKDKQRSTKHPYKTKDRVTRAPL
jgi:hypothetical protein